MEKHTSRVRLHRKPRPHLDPGGGWLKAQAHGFTSWLWDSREQICCHPWPPGPSHRDHIGITGSSLSVCLSVSVLLSLFFCPGLPERDLLWAWAKDILGCISNPSQSKVPGPREEVTRDTASHEPTTSQNVSSTSSSVTCCTVICYPELQTNQQPSPEAGERGRGLERKGSCRKWGCRTGPQSSVHRCFAKFHVTISETKRPEPGISNNS